MVTCDSCGYPARQLKSYTSTDSERPVSHLLCWICANTYAGVALFERGSRDGHRETMRTIAFVGNVILDRLDHRWPPERITSTVNNSFRET